MFQIGPHRGLHIFVLFYSKHFEKIGTQVVPFLTYLESCLANRISASHPVVPCLLRKVQADVHVSKNHSHREVLYLQSFRDGSLVSSFLVVLCAKC